MGIISSIFDTDLYKFTQQQAVLDRFPEADVTYNFIDRNNQTFSDNFLKKFDHAVKELSDLEVSQSEINWLQDSCPYFSPAYLSYLKNYRFDPGQLSFGLDKAGRFKLSIRGSWHSTILWEVPLLAIISECYFRTRDINWTTDGFLEKTQNKSDLLEQNECQFADFGTRRRRNLWAQESVVKIFKHNPFFVGTSNVSLAKKYGVRPIGTMAHEWIQGVSALMGLRHANRFALEIWRDVYNASLGIALPDTFGTVSFWRDFDNELARVYDGVRHDSGSPFQFTDDAIKHYEKLGIDPISKTIVFSNSLNVKTAIELRKYCYGKIKCSMGIGTHFTNDFDNSPPLNIVIKLRTVNGIETVKLSDDIGKATGDPQAIRVAAWTHFGKDLDQD